MFLNVLLLRKCDIFTENYSTLTLSVEGYGLVLILCVLLSWLIYDLSGNKMAFLIVLGGLVPNSWIHEILAYVAFFSLSVIFISVVRYTVYFRYYVLALMITLYLYLDNYGAVNALCEFVYLNSICILSLLIRLGKKDVN